MKLKELALKLGCTFTGDPDTEIYSVKSIKTAGEGDITFVKDKKAAKQLSESKASAFIVSEDFPEIDRPTLRVKNVYYSFAIVQGLFYEQPLPKGPLMHPTAVVAEDAVIGKDCYIGPHVVIMEGVVIGDGVRVLANTTIYPGVKIGNNCLIHSNCTIREFCVLGSNVIVQNGAVIGSDGFGFAKSDEGTYTKILQKGKVIIEDDVEIQSNTCIDRGTLDDTVIGKGTKLDNLVQIGHGCEIGQNCVMASQVGLAGSTKVGNGAIFAGQVGVAGHCTIEDDVIITAKSGVHGYVEKGRILSGSPASDNKTWLKSSVLLYKLPEMHSRLRKLEKLIEKLDKNDSKQ